MQNILICHIANNFLSFFCYFWLTWITVIKKLLILVSPVNQRWGLWKGLSSSHCLWTCNWELTHHPAITHYCFVICSINILRDECAKCHFQAWSLRLYSLREGIKVAYFEKWLFNVDTFKIVLSGDMPPCLMGLLLHKYA